MERMTLQVMEVVSMLLVRAGIETHPGPTYMMYLVLKLQKTSWTILHLCREMFTFVQLVDKLSEKK